MRVATLGVALAGAMAIAVGAASATEATITPGIGIGKIAVGMTVAQVKHALGNDYVVNDRSTVGGSPYLELGWNFSSWDVGLLKTGPTFRAVQIGTTLRAQRTSTGIGPGTSWRKLVRTYPNGVCAKYPDPEYLLTRKGGNQTIFKLKPNGPEIKPGFYAYTVAEALVRKPFERLPDFNTENRCAPGWRNRDLP